MALVTDDDASVCAHIPEDFDGFFVIKTSNGYLYSHTFFDIDYSVVSPQDAVERYLRTGYSLLTMRLNGYTFCRKWKHTSEVYEIHGIPFPVMIEKGKFVPTKYK